MAGQLAVAASRRHYPAFPSRRSSKPGRPGHNADLVQFSTRVQPPPTPLPFTSQITWAVFTEAARRCCGRDTTHAPPLAVKIKDAAPDENLPERSPSQATRHVKPVSRDKIEFKHVWTEVAFTIGSEFIIHALDNSEPMAELQGNKKRIPCCQVCGNTGAAANEQTSEARLYKGLWSIAYSCNVGCVPAGLRGLGEEGVVSSLRETKGVETSLPSLVRGEGRMAGVGFIGRINVTRSPRTIQSKRQCLYARVGGTGYPPENPPTSDMVRKRFSCSTFGSDPTGTQTSFPHLGEGVGCAPARTRVREAGEAYWSGGEWRYAPPLSQGVVWGGGFTGNAALPSFYAAPEGETTADATSEHPHYVLAYHQGEPVFVPDDATWFPRGSPVSLAPLHSGAAPYSPHVAPIGSQDLAVKSRLNLSTPLQVRQFPQLVHWHVRLRSMCVIELSFMIGAQNSEYVPNRSDTAAERLVCSPLTNAIRVQFPAGSLRIFACRNRAGRCHWSAGFIGVLPYLASKDKEIPPIQLPVCYGAVEAEWLDCSPPNNANRVRSPAGLLPVFRKWESCWRCRWSVSFLGDLQFPRIQELLYTHLSSPASALITSMRRRRESRKSPRAGSRSCLFPSSRRAMGRWRDCRELGQEGAWYQRASPGLRPRQARGDLHRPEIGEKFRRQGPRTSGEGVTAS
ncbi:hypothetical protein PR048_030934 [Dryococelus australis]|uniref:Uncharacterized protein n=1 Tax=Dryococelus australis TaxID=614101 RepID=A0ABQ9GAA2_9NEOP|nr:hypothetical protein PR048_030934 [Dryococelus australis]